MFPPSFSHFFSLGQLHTQGRLIERIAEANLANQLHCEVRGDAAPASPIPFRFGYMGHLIRLAAFVDENLNSLQSDDPLLEVLQTAVPESAVDVTRLIHAPLYKSTTFLHLNFGEMLSTPSQPQPDGASSSDQPQRELIPSKLALWRAFNQNCLSPELDRQRTVLGGQRPSVVSAEPSYHMQTSVRIFLVLFLIGSLVAVILARLTNSPTSPTATMTSLMILKMIGPVPHLLCTPRQPVTIWLPHSHNPPQIFTLISMMTSSCVLVTSQQQAGLSLKLESRPRLFFFVKTQTRQSIRLRCLRSMFDRKDQQTHSSSKSDFHSF